MLSDLLYLHPKHYIKLKNKIKIFASNNFGTISIVWLSRRLCGNITSVDCPKLPNW